MNTKSDGDHLKSDSELFDELPDGPAWQILMNIAETNILWLLAKIESDPRIDSKHWQIFIDEPLYKSEKEEWVYTLMARKHKDPDQLKIAVFLKKWDGIIDDSLEIKDGNLFIIYKEKEDIITIYQAYEVEEWDSWALVNVDVNSKSPPDTGSTWEYQKIWTIENGKVLPSDEEEGRNGIWNFSQAISPSQFIPGTLIRTYYGKEILNTFK